MSAYKYKLIGDDAPMESAHVEVEKEKPTVYLDVGASQLKGLEVGQEISITIKGTVKGLRMDTEDSWGTGASIRVALDSNTINSGSADDLAMQEAIDSMLD